ncbi:vacuolar protein sorting protein VPS31 [Acrasis kona]|uniref:Vacuolar protein sorting protein VPS31 n=1 Tax=Acrasis kona TaxID=1008807 RepID=A0AAW2YY31_9EUKA
MLNLEIQQLKMKRTDAVEIAKPLKEFIARQYGEPVANEYNSSLQNFQQKRAAMLNLQERSEGSKDNCLKYAAELDYIAKHFPINTGAPRVNIMFSWFDSLTGKKVSQGNTSYEKASVLFNAAVLEMQIGAAENRQTEPGCVQAAKRFQSAAGIFQYIKERVTPNIVERITDDLTPDSLDALTNLMLAYAQMCVCENAKRKKMKSGIVSKLCMETSSLFELVSGQLQTQVLSAVYPKTWPSYCGFVGVYYNAVAQYYASVELHENDEIGKEITRLHRAVDLCNQAKNYKISSQLKSSLSEFEQEVIKNLNIADKENNKIYHERIPAFEMMDAIEKKRLAKPTPINNLQEENGVTDQYFNLFPIPVMEAKIKFTEQLNQKLQAAFRASREHRERIRAQLTNMGLPGSVLAADSQKSGFPKDVHDKIQKIESTGGLRRIHELKTTLDEMASEANQRCEKIKQIMVQEAADDDECRRQYQQRWPRLPSQNLTVNLYKQLNEYDSKVKQAQKSDLLVDQKINDNKEGFSHFSKPQDGIDALVPNASVNDVNSSFGKSYKDLKTYLAQLDDCMTRQESSENDISSKQKGQGIEQVLLKHEGNLDQCVAMELAKYDQDVASLQPFDQQLQQIMNNIANSNNEFVQSKTSSESTRKREQVIQNMYNSINKYGEVIANMQEGINFYTTMQDIINKLYQRVSDFVFARRTEKQDLIANLQHQLSGVQPHTTGYPPQQQQPQQGYQYAPAPQYQPQQQRYYNPQQPQLPPPPYGGQQPPHYQQPNPYGQQPPPHYGQQPPRR